jgi:hypothetical protein
MVRGRELSLCRRLQFQALFSQFCSELAASLHASAVLLLSATCIPIRRNLATIWAKRNFFCVCGFGAPWRSAQSTESDCANSGHVRLSAEQIERLN